MLAEVEIFGPVLVAMTFRTPDEAVALANNTRYGLAASVWSENINRALEIAAQIKAGVIWINSTNLFDAAAGFGGYRESGFGREGGREGLSEYLAPAKHGSKAEHKEKRPATLSALPGQGATANDGPVGIDRTAKLYVGGKQARPDSGYSYAVADSQGAAIGQAGLGNRKDIRNAVEAAGKAASWGAATGHNRAQVLFYLAENLNARAAEFAARLKEMTGKLPADQGARRKSRPRSGARSILRRLCRQLAVRRRRSIVTTLAPHHAGDERTLGNPGNRLPAGGAAARADLARGAGDRDGQQGRRRSPAPIHPPRRDRFRYRRCSTPATFPPAGVDQYRDRRARRARQ